MILSLFKAVANLLRCPEICVDFNVSFCAFLVTCLSFHMISIEFQCFFIFGEIIHVTVMRRLLMRVAGESGGESDGEIGGESARASGGEGGK